jgi:signal transduction histidine kinase
MASTSAPRRARSMTNAERERSIAFPSGRYPSAMDRRLFSAFFTTTPDGLGMGPSISRSIIDAHGGRRWATPNPTHGATCHFALPAIQ